MSYALFYGKSPNEIKQKAVQRNILIAVGKLSMGNRFYRAGDSKKTDSKLLALQLKTAAL